MNLRACSAKEFFNNELDFFEVFEIIRTNDIIIIEKFTDCSFIEIFDYFTKRYCFDLIESMTTIDYLFDNELP